VGLSQTACMNGTHPGQGASKRSEAGLQQRNAQTTRTVPLLTLSSLASSRCDLQASMASCNCLRVMFSAAGATFCTEASVGAGAVGKLPVPELRHASCEGWTGTRQGAAHLTAIWLSMVARRVLTCQALTAAGTAATPSRLPRWHVRGSVPLFVSHLGGYVCIWASLAVAAVVVAYSTLLLQLPRLVGKQNTECSTDDL
jgi:hypothetical protein